MLFPITYCNKVGAPSQERRMVPHPLDGAIPKLNLSDMPSPATGGRKQWRVYVQLIEALLNPKP